VTPLKIDVALVDVYGMPAVGGGTWQVTVTGAPVALNGPVTYARSSLSVTLAVSSWTKIEIEIKPDRYARANFELSPGTSDPYRSDTLVTVKSASQSDVSVELPLLRVREAPGDFPTSVPKMGSNLKGPWVSRPPANMFAARTQPVYRELLENNWLLTLPNITSVEDSSSTTGVFGDPDKDGWSRFYTNRRGVVPIMLGAPMLLEYGEIGTSPAGPRFLVGIWAPNRLSSTIPTWRDVVVFQHPSTAIEAYPAVAFPFRDPYPYVVGENSALPQGHKDRSYQPYVNLALRYFVGEWIPYHRENNEAILVMPILPHPLPQQPDVREYGLPFRTPEGMLRLISEVNLFLHRIRYGFSGTNLIAWWGSTGTNEPTRNSVTTVAAPPTLRKLAVAAYSGATLRLDTLLTNERLSNSRYPNSLWGRGTLLATLNEFFDAWVETWGLDLLAASTTVPAATFEQHLKAWLDGKSNRRLLMGGSGTTGHSNPDTHYPTLAKAATSRISAQSTSAPGRHAMFWKGPGADPWKAIFCTNAYLSATNLDPSQTPQFPVSPTDDEAHGFMFRIASGFAFGETRVGVP
jgi:hypothetical protein